MQHEKAYYLNTMVFYTSGMLVKLTFIVDGCMKFAQYCCVLAASGPVWTAAVVLTVDISTLTFLGRTSESDGASVVSVDCSNLY